MNRPAEIVQDLRSLKARFNRDLDRLIIATEQQQPPEVVRRPASRKLNAPAFRRPGPEDFAQRSRRWARYELLVYQVGFEFAAAERSPSTQNFFAAKCRLSPSEVSRWLPPEHGSQRKREITVGSKTDLDIAAAVDREIKRMEILLSNCHGDVKLSMPLSPRRHKVESYE
jgi:hypothetical protein